MVDASQPDAATPPDAATTVYPNGVDPSTAKALQALLFAAATQTAAHPFSCTFDAFTKNDTPVHATNLAYTIATAPTSSGGPDDDTSRDDSVLFATMSPITDPDDQSNIDGSESMDVSYIPSVDPKLSIAGDTYTYQFEGVLVDQLVLTGNSGVVSSMTFTKSSDPNQIDVLLRIACTKTS